MVTKYFKLNVETHCLEKKIPFRISSLMNNAPGYPRAIMEMPNDSDDVFILHTTSIMQPVAITTFQSHYLRNMLGGTSLAVLQLRLCTSTVAGMRSSPGQPCKTIWHDQIFQRKEKKKTDI